MADFEVKPIRTEADYEAAMAEMERLWGATLGTPEGDKLDVLATLVEAYELAHHPLDPPDPIEAIKFRMEQEGLTRRDLEPLIGGRGRVTEVLGGKRRLSLAMIRRLSERLRISADVLVRLPKSEMDKIAAKPPKKAAFRKQGGSGMKRATVTRNVGRKARVA